MGLSAINITMPYNPSALAITHRPVLLASRDMQSAKLMAKNYWSRVALMSPVALFVAFTGCSTLDSNNGETAIKGRVSTYVQPSEQQPGNTAADAQENPGDEWFRGD
jgi:hypothetical protein